MGEKINSSAGVSKIIPGGGEQYDSQPGEHSNSAGVGEYDKSRGGLIKRAPSGMTNMIPCGFNKLLHGKVNK